ncbi:MAG: glycosyltransferase [Synergistales bacterium]|nr:glycosyltransferase [Synergistales bacterium]
MPRRLGEVLVEGGYISPADLEEALEKQKTWRTALGNILLALGKVNSLQLAMALSEAFGVPYHDPTVMPPDDATLQMVVQSVGEACLRRYSVLPVKQEDGTLYVVSSHPEWDEPMEEIARKTGMQVERLVASERDMTRALRALFHREYLDESVMGLFYRNPDESAIEPFTSRQFAAIYLLLSFGLFGLWAFPRALLLSLFALINIFYLISIGFKFAASMAGAYTEINEQVSDEEVAALDDESLPFYTVLLPMYREPEVVAPLVESLKALDYPTGKLDVKLLLEEEDEETLEALHREQPPAHFEIIRVPYAQPKTKPKACNYGLLFARGEYLTIYDAEDIPEPDQLKKVVVAFRKGPANLICVQAALNYFNRDQNLLTRMFTLEYSYWFDYMLPGIERLKLPIPLGGTSNHFKTDVLKELGGWDPFNVTEDADLGVRAGAHNLRVATVNATTYEEANSRVYNWIRQRSRWIKGYMQTYLVHMRRPVQQYRRIGGRAFWGFQMMIGGTFLTFLINPILWALFIFWLIFRPLWLETFFPPTILVMSYINLVVGNAVGIYMNMLAVFRRDQFQLTLYALVNPFYWILHSIAAYKALWQLFTKPFYWEKTVHGLAKK